MFPNSGVSNPFAPKPTSGTNGMQGNPFGGNAIRAPVFGQPSFGTGTAQLGSSFLQQTSGSSGGGFKSGSITNKPISMNAGNSFGSGIGSGIPGSTGDGQYNSWSMMNKIQQPAQSGRKSPKSGGRGSMSGGSSNPFSTSGRGAGRGVVMDSAAQSQANFLNQAALQALSGSSSSFGGTLNPPSTFTMAPTTSQGQVFGRGGKGRGSRDGRKSPSSQGAKDFPQTPLLNPNAPPFQLRGKGRGSGTPFAGASGVGAISTPAASTFAELTRQYATGGRDAPAGRIPGDDSTGGRAPRGGGRISAKGPASISKTLQRQQHVSDDYNTGEDDFDGDDENADDIMTAPSATSQQYSRPPQDARLLAQQFLKPEPSDAKGMGSGRPAIQLDAARKSFQPASASAACRVCQAQFADWEALKAHIRAEGHHSNPNAPVLQMADKAAGRFNSAGRGIGARLGSSVGASQDSSFAPASKALTAGDLRKLNATKGFGRDFVHPGQSSVAAAVLRQQSAAATAPATAATGFDSGSEAATEDEADPDDPTSDGDRNDDDDDDAYMGGQIYVSPAGDDADERDEDGDGDIGDKDDTNEDADDDADDDDDDGGVQADDDDYDDADGDAHGADGDPYRPLAGTPVFAGFSSQKPAAAPPSLVQKIDSSQLEKAPQLSIAKNKKPLSSTTLSSVAPGTNSECIGVCEDMCPLSERLERKADQNVRKYELLPLSSHPEWTLRETMVKVFRRSSADMDLKIPEFIRTPNALLRTVMYLEKEIIPLAYPGSTAVEEEVEEQYIFLENCYRMVMKDFLMQTSEGLCPGFLWVECHERIARFYIWSMHSMRQCESFLDSNRGIWQQNGEQLNNCLKSLIGYYHAFNADSINMPNKAELIGYYLLNQIGNGGECTKCLMKCSKSVIASAEVSFFLAVWAAVKKVEYAQFFKLLRRANFLQACVMYRYVGSMRLDAIKRISKHYVAGGTDGCPYPVDKITELLMFEGVDDCVLFLVDGCGMEVVQADDNSGALHVMLTKQNIEQQLQRDKNGNPLQPFANHMANGIDSKCRGYTPADICRGAVTGAVVLDNEAYLATSWSSAPKNIAPIHDTSFANTAPNPPLLEKKKRVAFAAEQDDVEVAHERLRVESARRDEEAARAKAAAAVEVERRRKQQDQQREEERAKDRVLEQQRADAIREANREAAAIKEREDLQRREAAAREAELARIAALEAEKQRVLLQREEARRLHDLKVVEQERQDDLRRQLLLRQKEACQSLHRSFELYKASFFKYSRPGLAKRALNRWAEATQHTAELGLKVSRMTMTGRSFRAWYSALLNKRTKRLLLLETLGNITAVSQVAVPSGAESWDGAALSSPACLPTREIPFDSERSRIMDILVTRERAVQIRQTTRGVGGMLRGMGRPLTLHDARHLLESCAVTDFAPTPNLPWSPAPAIGRGLFLAQSSLVRRVVGEDDVGMQSLASGQLWGGDLLLKLAVVAGQGHSNSAQWIDLDCSDGESSLFADGTWSLFINLVRMSLCPPPSLGLWDEVCPCWAVGSEGSVARSVKRRVKVAVLDPPCCSSASNDSAGTQAVLLMLPAQPTKHLYRSAFRQLCGLYSSLTVGAPIVVVVVSIETAAAAVATEPYSAQRGLGMLIEAVPFSAVGPAADITFAAVRSFIQWVAEEAEPLSGDEVAPSTHDILMKLDHCLKEAFLVKLDCAPHPSAPHGSRAGSSLGQLLRYTTRTGPNLIKQDMTTLQGLLDRALLTLSQHAIPLPLIMSITPLGYAQESMDNAVWGARTIREGILAVNLALEECLETVQTTVRLGNSAGLFPAVQFSLPVTSSSATTGLRAVPNAIFEDRTGLTRSNALPLGGISWVDLEAMGKIEAGLKSLLLPDWPTRLEWAADQDSSDNRLDETQQLLLAVDEYAARLRRALYPATGFAERLKQLLLSQKGAGQPALSAWRRVLSGVIRERVGQLERSGWGSESVCVLMPRLLEMDAALVRRRTITPPQQLQNAVNLREIPAVSKRPRQQGALASRPTRVKRERLEVHDVSLPLVTDSDSENALCANLANRSSMLIKKRLSSTTSDVVSMFQCVRGAVSAEALAVEKLHALLESALEPPPPMPKKNRCR